MVNQQLVEYIKTNVSNGFSLDDVKKKIIDSGVSQADVDEAINESGVGNVKQPSEEVANQQPTEAEQPQTMIKQAEPEEKTFKWWVIAIPLIILVIMWGVFYFLLGS